MGLQRLFLLGIASALSATAYACVGDTGTPPVDAGPDTSVTKDAAPDTGDAGGTCDDGGETCNGGCVDTANDAKNCGRCAHDCGQGKCTAGVCQPVLVAGDPDGGVAITSVTTDQTDDNPAGVAQHVFWASTGTAGGVFQDNVIGGNTIKLSTSSATTQTNVVVNQANVFWFIQNFGGPPQPILKGQVGSAGSQTSLGSMNGSFVQSILYEPKSQYVWGSYASNSTTLGVFKCQNGSNVTCTSVTTASGQPGGNVATDGTYVYYANPNNGLISWASFTGNVGAFIQNQATPTLLRVDGTSMYWFNSGTKTLERAALTGPTAKQLASAASAVDGLAADAVNVYWTESASGTVSYAPITGAGPNTPYVTTLGPSTVPMRLVRDTGFLYFSHNSAIYRVALP
jgi:hypothetical protein